MGWINRVSHLFQPTNALPQKSTIQKQIASSKGYQLMINAGIINNLNTGMFALLPLGTKVLEKLVNLVDKEMMHIGGQKIILPILTSTSLWKQTDRFALANTELFTLRDRHGKEYIISPTFEESISCLLSNVGPLKRHQLPLRLYQVSSKLRDEMKPRLGLLRSREFIMKDMYTFDVDINSAKRTYQNVSNAYENIFKQIGIPVIKVAADNGIMGGTISHEYHYISYVGEDSIFMCEICKYYENVLNASKCPICQQPFIKLNSIEVGHTFLLGTKYSKSLKVTFVNNRNVNQFLEMGCYGLGLTRIIAAAIEILSTELEIRWPLILTPYYICIIPPKSGSKEESASQIAYDLYFRLQNSQVNVIVDDRTQMTIGKRIIDARRCGYPYVVVIGKNYLNSEPLVELHNLYNESQINLPFEDAIQYINNLIITNNN